ncbi:divergent polysaccharide deacetylase family protein [Pseudomaricurvus sp. HS19]|uniref:divergent polysaccharide deacetylase family protein n=1 Tax=Pseudomaricurvus sp. HS19 TaxID=2692626 RepID=UPI00136E53E6|nr:divergent polysaccharide deacetylase family protein [Pseudomaricurvus sp. HS19]MYM63611.1 divergent polysaccharide deacetylase family protein [Pseudomaricurvus sp. HS19]
MTRRRYTLPTWSVLAAVLLLGIAAGATANAGSSVAATPALSPSRHPSPASPVKIAIIIDDIGYSLRRGGAMARLPGPVTLAILPHTRRGPLLAELGYRRGKEIMLHAPMSTLAGKVLDKGALTEGMSREKFQRTITDNLAAIPHVSGINNHMGSQLTQLQQPMQWLMTELADTGLYFVDSRTSAASLALQTAQAMQIRSGKRDVFLDNERDEAAIETQLETLIQVAREQGSAIGIGHPYPETHAVLKRYLPRLQALGVELVPVSELLAEQALARDRKTTSTPSRTAALNTPADTL